MSTPDLVIRGGTVVDGTGAAPRDGDVVIEGDRIAAIGTHDGPAREVIDAQGPAGHAGVRRRPHPSRRADHLGSARRAVEPARRHLGRGRQLRRRLRARASRSDRDYLMFLMEGVEDVPRRRHARRPALELGDAFPSTSTRSRRSRSASTSARTSATRRCASARWASAAPPTPSPTTPSWRRCARRSPRRCAPARSASPPAARRCTARRPGIRCRARSPSRRELDALGRRARRGGRRRLRAGAVRRRRRGRRAACRGVRVDDAAGARHQPADQLRR